MRQFHHGISIAVCFCLDGAIAFATPPEIDWTASYNGPGSYWESVNDATVRAGFLYVAGFTSLSNFTRGYITVKYSPDGTEAWSRIYEGFVGHASEADVASAVAVDESGNVYVTGYSVEADDDSLDVRYADAATLKYSPEGELLWEQRYRGSGANVQPSAIVVDPEGSVYVTGGTWINGGFDVFLLKYDLEGNLLWSRTRGQPNLLWDNAFAMALDGTGDVVLGGYTQTFFNDVNVYILKYGSDGSFHWEWSLFGVADVEQVNDLTVDSEGNTYALAEYAPPATFTSLLTVKLSPSGVLLWSDVYTGQSTGDYAGGIELSPDGSVFSAGAAWENGSQNGMTLIKYTPDGQRLWARSQRGGYYSAECNDLAVDADGAAYMTGFAFNENNREDFLTAKYDGSGNLVWTASWDAPEGRSEIAYQVRVGTDRRVYVVGDAWRDFDNYYDITSVVYRQGETSGIGTPGPSVPNGSERVRLAANPNPTSGETVFEVSLPQPDDLRLSIYDVSGRLVRKLLKGQAGAGINHLTWDGRSERGDKVAPGVYLIHLTSRTGVTVGRVTRVE
jgi:FlgD Ig-like domain/Beta-propeller repeat